jgi:hypothetical protein
MARSAASLGNFVIVVLHRPPAFSGDCRRRGGTSLRCDSLRRLPLPGIEFLGPVSRAGEQRGQGSADLKFVEAGLAVSESSADLAKGELSERLRRPGAVDPWHFDPLLLWGAEPDLAKVVRVVVDRPLPAAARVSGQLAAKRVQPRTVVG